MLKIAPLLVVPNERSYSMWKAISFSILALALMVGAFVIVYSSPAFYKGSIYIGLSSFGDCSLVQGQLIKLNAKAGAIQHIFSAVPAGCPGGGVWGSPTIDTTDNSVYFATGNNGSCGSIVCKMDRYWAPSL